MALCLITINLKAQSQTKDYFVGKWEVVTEGIPSGYGSGKMLLDIARKDGKLEGVLTDPETKAEIKIVKISEKENQITLYLDSEYGEVEFLMVKVDDNNVRGDVMNMFDIKGKRVESK